MSRPPPRTSICSTSQCEAADCEHSREVGRLRVPEVPRHIVGPDPAVDFGIGITQLDGDVSLQLVLEPDL